MAIFIHNYNDIWKIVHKNNIIQILLFITLHPELQLKLGFGIAYIDTFSAIE